MVSFLAKTVIIQSWTNPLMASTNYQGSMVSWFGDNMLTWSFCWSVLDLRLGELVHDDMFGLFDAMSAIEMMDPKMDVGMLCNSSQRRIRSFEQAVEVGVRVKKVVCWDRQR